MAGRTLGKLSCSLSIAISREERLPDHLIPGLLRLQKLATPVTPFLESLRAFDVNNPLEEASRFILSFTSYDELYDYCVGDLKVLGPFNYEAAEILTISRDTLKAAIPEKMEDSELLVSSAPRTQSAFSSAGRTGNATAARTPGLSLAGCGARLPTAQLRPIGFKV